MGRLGLLSTVLSRFRGKSAKPQRQRSRQLRVERLEGRELLTVSWTSLAHAAPAGAGTMDLLPDGSVIMCTGGNAWQRLVPDASGSYINGTWTRLANSNYSRLYDATQIMQDGRLFIAGGEYGNGAANGETYDPLTNSWTTLPSQSFGSFIDCESMMLPDGRVLVAPVAPSPSGYTTIFDPTTNTWSQGPKIYRGGSTDEQSFVKLPDDSILTIDGNTTSERYIPSLNQWVNDGAVPVGLFDGLGEVGAAVRLADGRVIYFGATSHTAIYTPSGSTSPGSWVAGPDLPSGLGCDDSPAAVLRDGTVLFVAGPTGTYNGPSTLLTFDPTTNTIAAATSPPTVSSSPYVTRMLALPNGDVLFDPGSTTLIEFNPGTTAIAAAKPTITSIAHNADGSMLLTGTLLNGINAGASYGDDAQMDSNYPIVRLVNGSNIYYARTFQWSSTGVATGSTAETTKFILPLGIPAGTYSAYLVANGIASDPTTLTVSTTASNAAPTVATAAAVSASPVTTATVNLSALGADDAGESNLTYTWTTTTASNSTQLPSFSINGTNAAKATTATFHQTGTYTFKVTITDSGGLSTTSTIAVTVNQTQTSVTVTPTLASLGGGSTQQFTATAYDQFGNSMSPQPSFTWALTSGTGSLSASGLYTATSAGTLATVSATAGSNSGTAQAGVVASPWKSADIGSPGVTGTAYDNGTTFTVQGGGADIWGTSDQFHYVYRTMDGNGAVIARVATLTNTGGWAKVGVMIRNSLSATDQYALECVTPSNGTAFQYRTTSGASAAATGGTSGLVAPYWVKIVRSGNTLTGYRSTNGTTWTNDGSTTIAMGTTVYIGLEVDAANNALLNSSTFDNVSVMAAQNDSLTVNQGVAGTVNVLANDTGPSGTTLSVSSVTQGSKGTVVKNADNTITYTPNAGTSGLDTFTYTSSDGIGDTATATVAVRVNGLQAFFHFDENTGTSTADATGSGYTGTLTSTTWTTGVEGTNGLSFDGTTSFVSVPAMNLNSNTVTISGWVKRNGTQSNFAGLVFSRAGTTTSGLHFGSANELRYTWNGAAATYNFNSGLVVPNNQWTFVALVITATNGTLYMQPQGGSMVSATNGVANTASAFDGVTDIGQDTSSGVRFFNGSMDEVHIYNTALNAASITALATLTPTVVAAAAAAPSPVTGSTTALSVVGSAIGGEQNLTYTWAATTVPSGAAAPTFSSNSTNASKNVTATFSKAGNYTLTVTMTDLANATTTSSVNVTVSQTLTSIALNPATANLVSHATQQFTATALDQFGAAFSSPPAFTWSVLSGVGAIDANGLYTASFAAGSATVRAASGGVNSNAASITVTNAAPTVAAAAAANPSPVLGTTTVLSTLGADDGGEGNLTYTWVATTVPSGAAAPTFSANGSNAAKSSTATFSRVGSYTFQVTIADTTGLNATSSVNVAVNPTLTTIAIVPSSTTLAPNQAQQFTATGYDQFAIAAASQPSFTWAKTSGVGSISAGGLYTSSLGGSAAITATSGSIVGNASITVTNSAPTATTGAAATPSPVTGTTTNLSVLGSDDGGEANLTYTWTATAVPSGAAAPTYSVNGNNAGKNATATFSKAGNYTFQVTIADQGGLSTTSSVSVTVSQVLVSVAISPASASLGSHGTRQFTPTSYDQFGATIATPPAYTWSLVSGVGSIDANGLYTASYASGSAAVKAVNSSIDSNTATIAITDAAPTVVTAAAASPTTIIGTTTGLSVLGGDTDDGGEASLTYTWAATSLPNGAASPTFSSNGTNAGKNATATFSKVGNYTFTVTIADLGGLSVASSVNVTVNQTLTTIAASPASVSLTSHQNQQFTALAFDQFGATMASQPGFTWSVASGSGTIDTSGLYAASFASSTAAVKAASAGIDSNQAAIAVTNAAPTVATAAAASPATVVGTSTLLSVLGADADGGGESNLTYSWVATGPGSVGYSQNGNNSAKNATATFSRAGNYTFTVTIADRGGLSTTSSANVIVGQTVSSIGISPSTVNLAAGSSQQFSASANDQFGLPLTNQPAFVWTLTGGGVLGSGGLYTAPLAGGTAVVQAATGNFSSTASVTFSGQAQWQAAGSSSSWNGSGNWKDVNTGAPVAAPGTRGLSGDTVLFANTAATTALLDGAVPTLAALTFNNAAASYTLAQGSGGSITLQGDAGAIVTDQAGNHTIAAPLSLAGQTTFDAASGANLTVSGGVSGAGSLTKTGSGTLTNSGAVNNGVAANAGRIVVATGGSLTQSLSIAAGARVDNNALPLQIDTFTNSGTFVGSAEPRGLFSNQASGSVQIGGGQVFYLQNAAAQTNAGSIGLSGTTSAQFESSGPFSNASGGTISLAAQNSSLRFDGGLTNTGSVSFTSGASDVFGNATNASTGSITVTGGATATFYGDVTQDGTFSVNGATHSRAVFFGTVSGSGGFSGGGDVFIAGDLRPSAGPAAVVYDGNLSLAPTASTSIAIGASSSSAAVTGVVGLDGTLAIAVDPSYRPAHNTQFQVLSFDARSGNFTAITGLDLGSGLHLVPTFTDHALILTAVQDGSGSWNVDANGVVSAPGNWSNALPHAAGDVATFGPAISAARTIAVDVPITLGALVFDSSTAGYTLIGPMPITLQALSGNAQVHVASGQHAIAAALHLASDTTFQIDAGSLDIGGAIAGNGNLTKSGPGSLRLSTQNTFTGNTSVLVGALYLADPNALPDGRSMTVAAGATLIFDAPANALPVVPAAAATAATVTSAKVTAARQTAARDAVFASDPVATLVGPVLTRLSDY